MAWSRRHKIVAVQRINSFARLAQSVSLRERVCCRSFNMALLRTLKPTPLTVHRVVRRAFSDLNSPAARKLTINGDRLWYD